MDIRREPNKTLGGAPKPKFTPKLPAQKKPADPGAPPPPAAPQIKSETRQYSKDRPQWNNGGGRGGRGRGGRGRGYTSSTPLQAQVAFFGSSSAAPSARQVHSGGYGISSQIMTAKSAGAKVKREQHSDSDEETAPAPQARSEAEPDVVAMEVLDEDAMESNGPEENWPDNYVYTRDAPASVPFGPPAVKTWENLADTPLFAHPNDTEGLDREETDSTFLIQFPTSVTLGANSPRAARGGGRADDEDAVDLTAENGNNNSSNSNSMTGEGRSSMSAQTSHFTEFLKDQKLAPGKIGKLQVMESGKVFLVTANGLRFEMHPGLVTCFSQYVAAVDSNGSADANAVKTEPGADAAPSAAAAPTDVSMFMLAPVSRKVIIAPSF